MWAAAVLGRESEPNSSARLRMQREIAASRLRRLEIDLEDPIPPQCRGGGWASLALDHVQERFILSGRGSGEVQLRDVETKASKGPLAVAKRRGSSSSSSRDLDQDSGQNNIDASQNGFRRSGIGHAKTVTSLAWFAADLGIFVSGGRDARVMVWDTNAFVPVSEFEMQQAIHKAALSPIPGAATAKLIACGSASPMVRLCDMSSGAHTQILKGHRAAVAAVAWSPASEYVLATGSYDRSIRLWDLRRSGDRACYATLDQHNAPLQLRRALVDAQHTAHDGAVTGLQFVASGTMLLSSGFDCRMRLWTTRGVPSDLDKHDLHSHEHIYENTFVNYTSTMGDTLAKSGIFVASEYATPVDKLTVYHSVGVHGQSVGCFDVNTGRPVGFAPRWNGHFMRITGLALRESTQELFSVGLDGLFLRWKPRKNTNIASRPGRSDASAQANHPALVQVPVPGLPNPPSDVPGNDAEEVDDESDSMGDEDEWHSDVDDLRVGAF